MRGTIREIISYFHDPVRGFMADEEDWIEGDVGNFLNSIRPFLEPRGISLTIENEQIGKAAGYSLVVNGVPLVLYSEEELIKNDLDHTKERVRARVNEILEAGGASERMYLRYGWNDLFVVFLTPECFQEIRETSGWPEHELPY
ncbi:MAG: hypothetical protein QM758_00710 [Armatimonas sp.]